MAKGDREFFKADTDDGYTKIADLLLEALAMVKLNGVQKGICLFIWRRTYGWKQKEDRISLKEFALACDTSEPYISRQLKQLIEWNVILRTSYEPGKVPVYTFNTRVAQWYKGCLNVQGLSDRAIQGLYNRAIQGLHDCTRVNHDSALEPQGIEPSLKRDHREYINNNDDDNSARAREEINFVKTCEQEFGRPISPTELETLQSFVDDGMSEDVVCEAIKRTRLNGHTKVGYTKSILNNWHSKGVKDMAGVSRVDLEFEQRKARDGPKGGHTHASHGSRDRPAVQADVEQEAASGYFAKHIKARASPTVPEVQ